ncbi:30S ribosomal protein S9 [Lentisphaera profundi]|uniref:Small ribosomal subunit protein uS9 n=1 Tax=Lentisphaera profundi TaxID=1658616 RepID=A0ABY7W0W5_9BACT|nr:30S ribosomal protein S9 [Lentisphaera profundi]WDE99113.1 30S ribosomal protein S9 [Lentisphaera profundi]
MSTEEIWATGRRKSAIARVKLTKGSGVITINKQKLEEYFPQEQLRNYLAQPITATGTEGQFDIFVNLHGGGKVGQAGALRHGISRAILAYDEDVRSVLKQSGLLTRDARVKERQKPGQPGARKRFQFSKR